MEPTIPEDIVNPESTAGELDKSNVQKRIDELTAERKAAEARAEAQSQQVAQLTAMLAAQAAQVKPQVMAPVEEQLADDATPAQVAKFLQKQHATQIAEMQKRTEQMVWQLQNQMDGQRVDSQYAHIPEVVRKDAAARLTNLKRQYGDNVNIEDAMALAKWHYDKQQLQAQGAQRFNAMGQPMQMQSGLPNIQSHSTNLVPPTQDPNWDNFSLDQQGKLINDYIKKGGRLID